MSRKRWVDAGDICIEVKPREEEKVWGRYGTDFQAESGAQGRLKG